MKKNKNIEKQFNILLMREIRGNSQSGLSCQDGYSYSKNNNSLQPWMEQKSISVPKQEDNIRVHSCQSVKKKKEIRGYSGHWIWTDEDCKTYYLVCCTFLNTEKLLAAGSGCWVYYWLTLCPLIPVEHATTYLGIVADHVHPFMVKIYHHMIMETSNKIKCQVTKHKISQTGSMNMKMSSGYFTGLTSHDTWIQLRLVRTGDSQDKHADAYLVNLECAPHGMYAMMMPLRLFQKPRWVLLSNSRVFLIKWPVSAVTTIYYTHTDHTVICIQLLL